MKTKLCGFVTLVVVCALTGLPVYASGPPELISIGVNDTLPNNVTSTAARTTPDGRYVYFGSYASNLVAGDTNNVFDIFVRDRVQNSTTRLSVSNTGVQANNQSLNFDVSDDGRYVVFQSSATNLTSQPDFNQADDIYLRDVVTGTTSLVYRDPGTFRSTADPKISGDGNYIIFNAAPSGQPTGLYRMNRVTGSMQRITFGINGASVGGGFSADVNYDGSVVTFTSQSPNFVSGDTNNQNDVFVWMEITNQITRVSVSSAGAQANNSSQFPKISNDGKRIVFESYATNLTPNGTANARAKSLLRDLNTNTTTLLSVTPSGQEGNNNSNTPRISGNGNFVSFTSQASNLIAGDTNAQTDVFIRDVQNNTTSIASQDPQFSPFGTGENGEPSFDGRFITFGGSVEGAGTSLFLIDRQPDIVAPLVTGTPDRQPNAAGWYNDNVTISWTATDPTPSSGTPTQPPATTASVEGTNTYVSAPSCDPAGNCGTGSLTLKIDKTNPTIYYTVSPAANPADWNNSDVIVTFACDDMLSGIASCSSPVTLTSEAAGQTVTGTAVDSAGNAVSVMTAPISIDKTQPEITYTVSPIANANGWSKTNVLVTFSCTDALSGVAWCSSPVTLVSEAAGQTVTGVATDNAGNTRSITTAPINIDKTNPTINYSVSLAPNIGGWNSSDVVVTFVCGDSLSGVASCSNPVTLSSETSGQTVTGVVVDNAGNSVSITTTPIKIDKTNPTISYTVSPAANANGWNNSNVTVTFTCSDALSGIAWCTSPITLVAEGSGQTVTGVATDNAGNTITITTTPINIDKTNPTVSSPSLSGPGVINLLGIRLVTGLGMVNVSAGATDALSGVVNGEYYVDTDPGQGNGTAMTYNSGNLSAQLSSSGLGIGNHTLYIRSKDKAGNWSSPSIITFTFI